MVFSSKELAADEGREPERLSNQLNAGKLILLESAPVLVRDEPPASPDSTIAEATAENTTTSTVYTTSTAAAAKSYCLATGYLDKDQLNLALESLATLNIAKKPVIRTQAKTDNYLVYIALHPKRSIEDALRPLRTAGVHDYYVMRENGQNKAISLGVFSTKEAALAHQENLGKKSLKRIAVRPFKISTVTKVTLEDLSEDETKSIRKQLAPSSNGELNECSNSKP